MTPALRAILRESRTEMEGFRAQLSDDRSSTSRVHTYQRQREAPARFVPDGWRVLTTENRRSVESHRRRHAAWHFSPTAGC